MHNLPASTTDPALYPILSAQNINEGIIDYNAKRYVTKETFEVENRRTDVKKGDVLLTIVATIGRTAVVKENRPFLLQRSVCVLKPKSDVLPEYLRYWLDTSAVQQYMLANAHGSAQAGLYLNQVSDMEIMLPSIETQRKIVETISKFDEVCSSISSGLPAEIEARQKQYEYYRDKLLTFKEL